MDDSIIVLTNKYPYQNGETFLETEIPILCTHFRKVYIFSFSKKSKEKRPVPMNAIVVSLGVNGSKFNKLKAFFLVTFSIKNKKKFQPKSFVERISFGLAILAKKRISSYLKTNGIFDFNVIYSYWFNFIATTSILLGEWLSLKGHMVKTISRVHGVDLYGYRHKKEIVPCQLFNIQNINFVSAISEDGMKYLMTKYNCYKNKILLNKLGSLGGFMNPNTIVENKIIVTCSNLNSIKRLDLLAFALPDINKSIPIRWICIGSGPDKKTIQEIIEKNKMSQNVIFKGWMKNDDVCNFYASNHVDLFVNVSSTEGLPVSIMEAMSFGIPCLATNVGGTSEIVNDDNGFLIPKEITSKDLAKIIIQVLNSDLNLYRKKSFETWEKNYNAKTNYDSWCQLLRKL